MTLTVTRPSPACTDPTFPLSLEFQNRSDRRVVAVTFSLVGQQAGYSNKVINDYWTYDKILNPRSHWGVCWRDHKYDMDAGLTAGLIWTGEINSITFE